MKVLIIRFSSIGDIVLTTPVVRCLHEQVPGVEIHYLTKSSYASLLSSNTRLSKIWSFSGDLKSLITQLKNENFDHIIDLHNNLRSKRVGMALRVTTKRVNKLNWEKWWMVRTGKNLLPDVHIVDRYLEAANHLNVVNDHKGLEFTIPETINIPIDLPSEYVCYAIGGQHATKKMPTNKIVDMCNEIKSSVVLIGGKEDIDAGDQVANTCKNVLNYCGKLSINESAKVMDQSKLVITHDTGMMHIAAALKKRIISIWGNTIPEFGMYPYQPDAASAQFEVKDLSCRPCSKIGFDKCPKGHFKCMNNQNTSEIAKRCNL